MAPHIVLNELGRNSIWKDLGADRRARLHQGERRPSKPPAASEIRPDFSRRCRVNGHRLGPSAPFFFFRSNRNFRR
jgi:hypothetical protein